jgi:hypothetical protein
MIHLPLKQWTGERFHTFLQDVGTNISLSPLQDLRRHALLKIAALSTTAPPTNAAEPSDLTRLYRAVSSTKSAPQSLRNGVVRGSGDVSLAKASMVCQSAWRRIHINW